MTSKFKSNISIFNHTLQVTKKTEDDFFKDSGILESNPVMDDGDSLMSTQSDNAISQSLNFDGLNEDISSPELR